MVSPCRKRREGPAEQAGLNSVSRTVTGSGQAAIAATLSLRVERVHARLELVHHVPQLDPGRGEPTQQASRLLVFGQELGVAVDELADRVGGQGCHGGSAADGLELIAAVRCG